MTPDLWIALCGLVLTALVRVLSNARCRALLQQLDAQAADLDAARTEAITLARELHAVKMHALAAETEENEHADNR